MSDLGELIVKILENGITLSTLIAAIVVLFKYREQHRIYRMLYLIGEKVGIEWKSSLHTNGFIFMPHQLSKKLSSYSPMVMRHLKIRRKKMKQLLSKKFLLAILGAIIPVINLQFGLNLDINTLIGIWAVLGMGIAGLAHVDGKTALAAVKVAITADPNATYKDMYKTVNIVHAAITNVLSDLNKNDGSKAFHDAADAYMQLLSVVNDFKKPDPLPEIPTLAETKVSA